MANGWGRRRRSVYAYDVADLRHVDRPIRIGYVGKSSSHLKFRDGQHRADKDWAWAIVGDIYPLWQGDCGRIRLWVMEVWFIHRKRPLFNIQHNTGNPDRIPPWQVKALYRPLAERYARTRRW